MDFRYKLMDDFTGFVSLKSSIVLELSHSGTNAMCVAFRCSGVQDSGLIRRKRDRSHGCWETGLIGRHRTWRDACLTQTRRLSA